MPVVGSGEGGAADCLGLVLLDATEDEMAELHRARYAIPRGIP